MLVAKSDCRANRVNKEFVLESGLLASCHSPQHQNKPCVSLRFDNLTRGKVRVKIYENKGTEQGKENHEYNEEVWAVVRGRSKCELALSKER